MGTRGLLGLIIAGKRHGSYNHWDSYPAGLGKDIVRFILSMTPEQWDEMARQLQEVTWVDQDDPINGELNERYGLLRTKQGTATLYAIQAGTLMHIVESVKFHQDTLFCEWAYFTDFENRTLQSYKGDQLLDTVSFDVLKELGDRYMTRMDKTNEEGGFEDRQRA